MLLKESVDTEKKTSSLIEDKRLKKKALDMVLLDEEEGPRYCRPLIWFHWMMKKTSNLIKN